jgi:hypothetical protein
MSEHREILPSEVTVAASNYSLSAGQVSCTARREVPKCEWTRRMVALTRDFEVFASRVTTGFSAVFFSIRYIAQARYVRALFSLLIHHYDSVLSISTDCMQISKPRLAASARLSKVLRSAVQRNELSSVGGLIARRYLDGL